MNKILKSILSLVCCSMSSLILGCARSPESESLGSIQFPASGTSSLILQISKSHKQPYGLRFGSPGIGIEEINKMSEDDKVEVFFENNDTDHLSG